MGEQCSGGIRCWSRSANAERFPELRLYPALFESIYQADRLLTYFVV